MTNAPDLPARVVSIGQGRSTKCGRKKIAIELDGDVFDAIRDQAATNGLSFTAQLRMILNQMYRRGDLGHTD